MKKLKETPIWLKVVRRVYAYMGAGFLGTLFTAYSITPETSVKVLIWYGFGSFVIQVFCDLSYRSEPIEPMKPDPTPRKAKF